MATIDIGKIKPVFKGTYDNSTAYVLDDIVYYNGSSYVAKTSTTGNLPTDTTKWNILASGSGGIYDSTLSIGSAGQVLKVNSGATALEFGTADSGKTLGVTQFSNNTRASVSNSTNALLWNGSYTQIKANSKLLIHFALQGYSGSAGSLNWRFVYDGVDHNHAIKYGYYPTYSISAFGHFLIDGASTTGSKNWEIRYFSNGGADSPFTIWNPSSSDDSRILNSANQSNFVIQELDF